MAVIRSSDFYIHGKFGQLLFGVKLKIVKQKSNFHQVKEGKTCEVVSPCVTLSDIFFLSCFLWKELKVLI